MIAVTGATGLLGQAIVRQLLDANTPFVALRRKGSIDPFSDERIIWKEADVLDPISLREALEGVTLIIHAAATVSFSRKNRDQIFHTNVEGTRNVVNACLEKSVSRMIHISSVAALGRQRGVIKVDEESKWVENQMNSDYAESKYLAELEVFRGQEEGLKIDIINPSVILGTGNQERSSAQLFYYVAHQRPFYTDATINYIDARDVVDLIFKLIEHGPTGTRFVANGGTVEIKQLFDLIATRLNRRAPRIKLGYSFLRIVATLESVRSAIMGSEPLITRQSIKATRDQFQYSNQKAIQQLDMKFKPLEETLDWCCAHYNKQSNPAS